MASNHPRQSQLDPEKPKILHSFFPCCHGSLPLFEAYPSRFRQLKMRRTTESSNFSKKKRHSRTHTLDHKFRISKNKDCVYAVNIIEHWMCSPLNSCSCNSSWNLNHLTKLQHEVQPWLSKIGPKWPLPHRFVSKNNYVRHSGVVFYSVAFSRR